MIDMANLGGEPVLVINGGIVRFGEFSEWVSRRRAALSAVEAAFHTQPQALLERLAVVVRELNELAADFVQLAKRPDIASLPEAVAAIRGFGADVQALSREVEAEHTRLTKPAPGAPS